jgi:hypothetical protein
MHKTSKHKTFFPDTVDILNPSGDAVFKLIFTRNTGNSRGVLDSLVSAFVGVKTTVLSITANEPPPLDNAADRRIRYDIACRFETGEPANLEMTLYPQKYEAARMEYHLARLYAGQDIHGVFAPQKLLSNSPPANCTVKTRPSAT